MSLDTCFFQGILHNHMGRREREEGEQTDICALLPPVWLKHFKGGVKKIRTIENIAQTRVKDTQASQ